MSDLFIGGHLRPDQNGAIRRMDYEIAQPKAGYEVTAQPKDADAATASVDSFRPGPTLDDFKCMVEKGREKSSLEKAQEKHWPEGKPTMEKDVEKRWSEGKQTLEKAPEFPPIYSGR